MYTAPSSPDAFYEVADGLYIMTSAVSNGAAVRTAGGTAVEMSPTVGSSQVAIGATVGLVGAFVTVGAVAAAARTIKKRHQRRHSVVPAVTSTDVALAELAPTDISSGTGGVASADV